MDKKPYLKGKKQVSKLGFGAWPLGNTAHGKTMSIEEGVALVHKALEKEINFFDTAPNYALGRSETILGKALEGRRENVVINSKFGHHADGEINFDEVLIRPSIKESLKRLKTHYLDSVILHNPAPDVLAGKTNHYKTLQALKTEGIIHGYGVSIDTVEELEIALAQNHLDVIELLFNVFSQSTRHLLDRIQAQGIALIIKVPLDSGWLGGRYHKDSIFTDIRSRWSASDRLRRHVLVENLKELTSDQALPKYALGFIWSYEAVTTIIPGIRSIEQLNEHIAASQWYFPDQLKAQFEVFYDRHIKDNPLPW